MNEAFLTYKELMLIDDEVLQLAEKIHKENITDFFTEKKASNAMGLSPLLAGIPLFKELEHYFNAELLSSYATFKSLLQLGAKHRIIAYHFENLIFRVVSFWEYLYQILNYYFHIGLYDDSARYRQIEMMKYDMKHIPVEDAFKIEYVKRDIKEFKQMKKDFNRKIGKLNKNNIIIGFQYIYEIHDNLKELLLTIRDNNIEKIKDIRNEIIHQRPAGAKTTISFGSAFPGYSIDFVPESWVDYKEMQTELDFCVEKIRYSLQLFYEIVYLNEFPNRKENAGKKYFVENIVCEDCKKGFQCPSELVLKNEILKFALCPDCNEIKSVSINEIIQVTEIDYGAAWSRYFDNFDIDEEMDNMS